MDCEAIQPVSNKEFLQAWIASARAHSVPITGGVELTERCNLRCVHCYLGEQDEIRRHRRDELTAAQWCDIIDQLADAGTLWLLITGGDPLLRKDFDVIYTHAKRRGLLVTIFTNGVLVDEETVSLFQQLPPFKVEITLYGASEATYEKITGVPGAYSRCRRGIDLLAEAGVRVGLKTVLMTHNRHEFEEIGRLAARYGERFRFDAEIQPRFTGDMHPLQLRLDPDEAARWDLADPDRRRIWSDYFQERTAQRPARTGRLYGCSAGTSSFFIDAYGKLRPCIMVRDIRYDLVTGRFAEGWSIIGRSISSKTTHVDLACNVCEHRMVCGSCPAFAKLESGSEFRPSPYQCAITQARAARLRQIAQNQGVGIDG